MNETNTMLIISNGNYGNIGYIVFFLASVFFMYCVVSVAVKKPRIEKLMEIKRLIEEGHERKLRHEEKD